MRDTWNDFRGGSEKENSSSADGGDGIQKGAPEKYSASTESEEQTSSGGGVSASEPVSFRPSGGLLGLRDRQRENDQQTPAIPVSPHVVPHMLSRGILGNSILDKDRTDFRERVALGGNEDRYERRSYNRDRGGDYGISNIDKERNPRMGGNHHSHNNSSRYGGGGMGSHSHYSYNSGDNRRRMYNDSRSNANEEPEWVSGGPTSQNDTIELRGFDDPPSRSRGSRRSPAVNDGADKAIEQNNGIQSFQFDPQDNASDADGDENDDIGSVNETKSNSKSEANRDTTHKSHDSNNNKNRERTEKGKKPSNDSDDENDEDQGAGKSKDNFNFEDFLKLDSISDFLTVIIDFCTVL